MGAPKGQQLTAQGTALGFLCHKQTSALKVQKLFPKHIIYQEFENLRIFRCMSGNY